MRISKSLLAFAIAASSALPASAAVSYVLSSTLSGSWMSLTLPSFVDADVQVTAPALSSCMVFNVACDEVGFIGNAYAAHLSQVDNGWQAISLKNSLGQGYFYFNAATFTSLGAHSSPFVPTTGTLTISAVPEPSTWMSLMLGLPLIWAGLRRRKARAGAQ